MNDATPPDPYARLIEPTTLIIQRLLPGPIERVWAYLVESDLRRRWLASGDMELKVGAPFALTWRNDGLTDPPGTRPAGHSESHTMESRITACDPPRGLAFVWGEGEVSITLEERDQSVLLTLTHCRIAERSARLMIGAGWHAHVDILAALLAGEEPASPFWDGWTELRQEYDRRLPA